MANDPMTVSVTKNINVAEGLKYISGTLTGPADYDATNGSVLDLSSYFETEIHGITFNGTTAAADALVYPTWVSDAITNLATGVVYFTWDAANSGDAQNARVFANVADTTNLGGYVWYFSAFGY